MRRGLGGVAWWVGVWAALAVLGLSGAGAGEPPDSPSPSTKAGKRLAARGLTRVGEKFILPAEEELKARLDQLQKLVKGNQEALRRTTLRSVVTARSQSLLADLQAWQLAINGLEAQSQWPSIHGLASSNVFLPTYPGLPTISELNQQQITTMFNVVAGVEADNAFEAAEALARQDDFDRARGKVRRAIEALAKSYRAIHADPDVPDALGTLTKAENRTIGLGPLADYARTLDLLERGMDPTRRLTTPKGSTAPDYGVAANLAQGARLALRKALGALQEWERQGASPATAPATRRDPARGEALRREVAGRRDRYVHCVALLRRAYDAYRPPPMVRVRTVEPIREPAEPGRIRALVERRRAELRASFVKEAERALTTTRVPLERADGGLWARVVVNGVADRRMRIEPERAEVRVSERFAERVGLKADPATGLGVLRSVQIGPFTVRDVRCRVSPGDEATAPATLGAPILDGFVVNLSDAEGPPALFLTRVEVEPIAPRPRPAGAPPAKVGRGPG